jgi:hypothetical protein
MEGLSKKKKKKMERKTMGFNWTLWLLGATTDSFPHETPFKPK